MDSSNDSKNRIAPLEIETLETVSSNLEIGNQSVPSTFSKTVHSIVRQLSNVTDNKTDSIHFILDIWDSTYIYSTVICITLVELLVRYFFGQRILRIL